MTTPTGTIAMTNINLELGNSSTAQISLNDTNVRLLAGIPSGTISMNNLRGKTWKAKYVTTGSDAVNRITAWPWTGSGFGTKYSDPATLPTSITMQPAANPTSTVIAYANTTSALNRIAAYPWSSSGFGTKYANPSPAPAGGAYGLSFNPDNSAIIAGNITTTPYIRGYAWSDSTGFGSAYADPATVPTGSVYNISFKDSTTVGISIATTPSISVYAWSGSGFGSKYSDPASNPGGSVGYDTEFSTNASNVSVIASARGNSPFIVVWPWSGGFGTVFSNPGTLPPTGGRAVTFNPYSDVLYLGTSSSAYTHAYAWNNSTGFGSKYANPATLSTGASEGVSAIQSANYVGFTSAASPGIVVYAWSGGFGSKVADPATLPGLPCNRITFF